MALTNPPTRWIGVPTVEASFVDLLLGALETDDQLTNELVDVDPPISPADRHVLLE